MSSAIPRTRSDLLKIGTMDPDFAKAWKARPVPTPKMKDFSDLTRFNAMTVPIEHQAAIDSCPRDVVLTEHYVPMRDGYGSRVLVCHKRVSLSSSRATSTSSQGARGSPVIILLHGGGHCLGWPEMELPLARRLVYDLNAVVVLPSYRLGPTYKFPYSFNDTWDTVRYIASVCLEIESSSNTNTSILPSWTNARAGFILGGVSAGSCLAGSMAHLARDHALDPPLTGQFLCTGTFLDPHTLPSRYKSMFFSRTQNADAPILDRRNFDFFFDACQPDLTDPLFSCFDQRHPDDLAAGNGREEDRKVWRGHVGLPLVYFQACGLDMTRDDVLVYEKVLREESKVPTRLDLYAGYPHCWWSVYPKLDMTAKRERDVVEGMRWLLSFSKEEKQRNSDVEKRVL